jgi:nicotinamidase-related amidase
MAISRRKHDDLHGNVPDASAAVLMLVDVINDLNFPGNQNLLKHAASLGKTIAALKARCRKAGIPAIYVNDNRNKWRSDFHAVISHCRGRESLGRSLVEPLLPAPDDYIVLKPKHSAFYATPLDTILSYLGSKSVILTGLTTAACVLLTAGEIYVRDLKLFVPTDCVAGLREKDHRQALELMRVSFAADTRPSRDLDLRSLTRSSNR